MQDHTITVRGNLIYGSEFEYVSRRTMSNSDGKTISISGNQWTEVDIEKTHTGFRIHFSGNMEEIELFQLFKLLESTCSVKI